MLIIVISITDQVMMRQTKSLVHFEILYVYSKVSLELLSFLVHSLSPGFELFFLTKCRRKTESFSFRGKLSPGVWTSDFPWRIIF